MSTDERTAAFRRLNNAVSINPESANGITEPKSLAVKRRGVSYYCNTLTDPINQTGIKDLLHFLSFKQEFDISYKQLLHLFVCFYG